jgi:hypothetical protein
MEAMAAIFDYISPHFILLNRGDILKTLKHFPGGADSTTRNWKIMSPLKISAKSGTLSGIKGTGCRIKDLRHDRL